MEEADGYSGNWSAGCKGQCDVSCKSVGGSDELQLGAWKVPWAQCAGCPWKAEGTVGSCDGGGRTPRPAGCAKGRKEAHIQGTGWNSMGLKQRWRRVGDHVPGKV